MNFPQKSQRDKLTVSGLASDRINKINGSHFLDNSKVKDLLAPKFNELSKIFKQELQTFRNKEDVGSLDERVSRSYSTQG